MDKQNLRDKKNKQGFKSIIKLIKDESKQKAFRLSSVVLIFYLIVCGYALWKAVNSAASKSSSELLSVLYIALLNICLLLVFELVAIKKIQYPLAKLTCAAERMAEGNYVGKVEIHGDDEVARLAQAFNKLRDIMMESNTSLQRYIDDLQDRVSELKFLTEINETILEAGRLDKVFDLITERLCSLLDGDMCCIALRDKDDNIRIKSLCGFSDEEKQTLMKKIMQGSLHYKVCPAMSTNSIVTANNLDREPNNQEIKNIYSIFNAKSLMAAPLTVDSNVIGSIVVWYRSEHEEFSEIDVNRFKLFANQVAVLIKSARMVDSIKRMSIDVIRAFANTIDARDAYTANHSDRVSKFAVALAQELGLSSREVEIIEYAGLLHDLGKVGIKEEILNKPGKLTPQEKEIMKKHVTMSAEIIKPIEFLADAVPIILHHHEWYNGQGYPDGLKGEEIPLGARILAVADAFEAMTSNRIYHKEVSLLEGAERLLNSSGTQFDPEIVNAMLRVVERIEAIEAFDMFETGANNNFSTDDTSETDLDPAV